MNRFCHLVLLLVLTSQAFAAEALPPGAKLTELTVRPEAVELTGPHTCAQLVISAKLDSGDVVDVTRIASIRSTEVAQVSPKGLIRPLMNGNGTVTATIGDKSISVSVSSTGFDANSPVSFVKDVQPVLAKLGCNSGTCHGAAQGKNGFKLSLRGYDPIYDHRALTDDLEGRRFNRAAVERSLMLMKPAGAIPHAGGVVWQPGEPYYELVRRWISEGVKLDTTVTRVKSIEISPAAITISRIGQLQQFAVIATYTDGSRRDVSAEAFLDSSNTEVATVDKTGLLTSIRRGETTILARYDGTYSAASVLVMGDRSNFVWKQQPVQNIIDELVDVKLRKMKITASDLCTDEEFIRRVYLDVTGLPPTADEVRAFLKDSQASQAKRSSLVDKLIGSEAYIEHWTNKWADMLQVNRKFLGDKGAASLRLWIREAVAKNTPYDQFTRSLLTASGSNAENPPAAYFKVLREPDAVMENTTQLFLAIRFNCNKCHDHPFEKWTQDQYYETAAFFAQVSRKEDPKHVGQRIGGTAVEGAKPLVELIEDAKTGDVKHERTGAITPPKFPFSHAASKPATGKDRRAEFAQWLTVKENPYFAKSYVNRIWSYLTGVGIIEPVDDIRAGNPATNPELLDRMTADFVETGFDTRKLMALICKSRTYQLSVRTNAFNKDDEINYSHALPRRLPAEVLFDSIHRATGAESKMPGLPAGTRAALLVDSNIDLPGGFLELFGKPVRESACECERSNTMMLGPVLAMVNGPIVGDAVRDPNNHIVKFTTANKDDAKVVEEVYLSVLNRRPTSTELDLGIKALNGATADHTALVAEYTKRKEVFDNYAKTIDAKMRSYEQKLQAQKPTSWSTLIPTKLESKAGPTPANAKESSTLTVQKFGGVLVTGKIEAYDLYTLTFEVKQDTPLTGLRLEALTDDSLPAKGPGRSVAGNFVLNELKLTYQGEKDEKPIGVGLTQPQASFQQDGYPISNATDNNVATGWAIHPATGKNQTSVFQFAKPINAKNGVTIVVTMDQRYGTGHNLGKFRFSVTTAETPKLVTTLTAEVLATIDTPVDKRTPQQLEKLREMFVAQDGEYQRLLRAVPTAPPSDPRAVGAQDLVWALFNTPAFLFNR
jgi:hypothetical protein